MVKAKVGQMLFCSNSAHHRGSRVSCSAPLLFLLSGRVLTLVTTQRQSGGCGALRWNESCTVT